MDLEKDTLGLSLAGNKVLSYDMKNLGSQRIHTTKLNWQVRSIACLHDNDSIVLGGIEGKIEIISVESPIKKLIFKCHRTTSDIFSVNCLSGHPSNRDVIASGGSDGELLFYDRMSKSKIFSSSFRYPITCGTFNGNGSLYGFGTGYDWSRGYEVSEDKVGIKVIHVSSTNLKM
jgi:mRNA export factor